ncbi:NAD(P)/FAD-dependent oxidoreductase [Aliiroseovarius sp. 2305UL8-7]|uniref:NAD(P)/FAD-dependent oxidoreductase n=1 Tax=Aliiroseovarius conchicola TaxID=3121637 RepID=UPI0035298596
MSEVYDIVVIGAGIIGVSTALELKARGRNPLLVDRKGIAKETSCGNAGAFAFPAIDPLATPGIMKKAPKWLVDPLGPLSVPPAYALQIMPWMLRFWRSSWRDRYEDAISAQASLQQHCSEAFERQLDRFGDPALIRREGQLELYQGVAEFNASASKWQRRAAYGINFDLLKSANEISEIQPGLNETFTHAGFTPGWYNTTDPLNWTEHLAGMFVGMGGQFRTCNIQSLSVNADQVDLIADDGMLHAKQIVICAGAWSHHLARQIGDRFPLETERGYNTTFAQSSLDLKTHLTFSSHGFAMSKINDGLRVGGAVELGGLKLPPNFKRARTLVQKAKRFFPGIELKDGTQWMGYRPSLPDSLPVIGPSGRSDRVIYAFGHGHLGLTQSAGTAEVAADISCHTAPAINIAPFAATRF